MKIKTLLFTAVLSTTALCSNVFAQDITLQSEDHDGLFDFEGTNLAIKEDVPEMNIDNTKTGDWVRYNGVDLTDIVAFSMRVASNRTNDPIANGDRGVTMHLGDLVDIDGITPIEGPGTLLGTLVRNETTNGWQDYIISDIPMLTATAAGVNDIYFLYQIGDINIDYFGLYTQASLPVLSTSDNVKNEAQISYYPNPATDALTIEMSTGDFNQYSILDLNGRVIKEAAIESGLRSVELNVSKLSKGLYLINLEGSINKTLKFIKQ